jgi:hypothetical protein
MIVKPTWSQFWVCSPVWSAVDDRHPPSTDLTLRGRPGASYAYRIRWGFLCIHRQSAHTVHGTGRRGALSKRDEWTRRPQRTGRVL